MPDGYLVFPELVDLTSYRSVEGCVLPETKPDETDDVLRELIALRDLHSDPSRWCNTGMGHFPKNSCIAAGIGIVTTAKLYGAREAVTRILVSALPIKARGLLVRFNEMMGTTHADLMAFYDRAIAIRRSEIGA